MQNSLYNVSIKIGIKDPIVNLVRLFLIISIEPLK
jgi:hypothetical protein